VKQFLAAITGGLAVGGFAALSGIPQPVALGMIMASGILIGTTVRPRP
jgi:hypothetical protein